MGTTTRLTICKLPAFLRLNEVFLESHWSLRRFYLYLNRKWHDGELPLDTILTWEPCQNDTWAECEHLSDGRYHIRIDPRIKGLHEFMLLLLHHEMCHVKVWGPKHGRRWQAEMRSLAARGAFDDLW